MNAYLRTTGGHGGPPLQLPFCVLENSLQILTNSFFGSVMPAIDHNLIAPEARKFQAKFDVTASKHERFKHMFDVIVNDAWKYSPNARKFETKAAK